MSSKEIIKIDNLTKVFSLRGKKHPKIAVDKVSLSINEAESICLIGESGSGKTTLARLIIGLLTAEQGDIQYYGEDTRKFTRKERKNFCRNVQIIFQNPVASLNPLRKVGVIIGDPLKIHSIVPSHKVGSRVEELLEMVGLPRDCGDKYPYEFSGGECQRIYIAKVLGMSPKLLLADEPLSSVDAVISAEILELICKLLMVDNRALLMITHDLTIAKRMSRILYVMRQGRIVEQGNTSTLMETPLHPYTTLLINCCLDKSSIDDDSLIPINYLEFDYDYNCCKHYNICDRQSEICTKKRPELVQVADDHLIACFAYT